MTVRIEGFDGRRVVIDAVWPCVDGGRHPSKRVVDEPFLISADLLVDGHDRISGVLLYRPAGDTAFAEVPLVAEGNDRYSAAFTPGRMGRWQYTVEAWVDTFGSWREALQKKLAAGQDVSLELLEGAALVAGAAGRAAGPDRDQLAAAAATLSDRAAPAAARAPVALEDALAAAVARHPDRRFASRREPPLEAVIDPLRARFSAWYEFFPRSAAGPGRHGTLRDAEARLAYAAEMGFDVVYLPPIHPIGRTFRKGKNNTLEPSPDDVGSPWAIGAAEGGHDAIHPQLGTVADFERFVEKARGLGVEVAIDVAFQASPDHPYVAAHPDWFAHRPDGTIQYAENPPKKYQDIYPFAFAGEAWQLLWRELLRVVEVWIARGVRIFRVDNPHTKPLPFWEWIIGEIKSRHPETVFLAEAFTRPKLMYALAKLGFSQSYTYFTWRTTRAEITQYLTEVTTPPVAEYFRTNLWPNTPDILPEHLQIGGRPAFIARAVLAATLSASWGIYGPAFELGEHEPRPGAEEYIDNEKYQLRDWPIDRPDSLRPILTRLNRIRRENPALQDNRGLHFHPTDNDYLIAYSKVTPGGENAVLVAVNLDPAHRHSGWVDIDPRALGLAPGDGFQVHDLLSEARYSWQGGRAYLELDPQVMPAHIFRVRRFARRERDFEYFA